PARSGTGKSLSTMSPKPYASAMTTVETPPSDLLALAERTALVDREASRMEGLRAQGCALLAVGGYGRRHLFPHSDVDLLLLFESDKLMAESKEAISAYLQRLWD